MNYLIDIILCLAILFTCKGQDVVLTTTRVCYNVNDDMTLEAEYKGQATVDGVIWTLTGGSSVMTIAVSTCSSPFVIPIGFPDGRMFHNCSTAPLYRLIVKTLESTDFNKTWGVDFSLITGSTSSGTQQQTVVQCETSASDCVLKAGSIVVILFSVILVIVVITMLWICLFRRLPSFGGCDRMRITWRYFKAWNGLTLLRATILVTVVAVVFDVFILVMTIYILCWCIDCEDKCTLDRCSDTWREEMMIFYGCCLGFLYIVIIILAILCNKHSDGEIAILHARLSEERNTGQNRTKKDNEIRPHPSLKPN